MRRDIRMAKVQQVNAEILSAFAVGTFTVPHCKIRAGSRIYIYMTMRKRAPASICIYLQYSAHAIWRQPRQVFLALPRARTNITAIRDTEWACNSGSRKIVDWKKFSAGYIHWSGQKRDEEMPPCSIGAIVLQYANRLARGGNVGVVEAKGTSREIFALLVFAVEFNIENMKLFCQQPMAGGWLSALTPRWNFIERRMYTSKGVRDAIKHGLYARANKFTLQEARENAREELATLHSILPMCRNAINFP